MSLNSPITEAHGWFDGETKTFRWTITDPAGAAVSMLGMATAFRLAPGAGQEPILEKLGTGITTGTGVVVEGVGNNVLKVVIDDSEYASLGLAHGVWYYMLWDTSNDVVLARGRAVLGRAIGAPVP